MGREGALGAEFFFEGGEFGAVGEVAVVEEVDDFLVGAVLHEVIDMVAEVAEFADVSNDVAE